MLLTVKLRDGFKNDTVILRVNEKEVYRKSNVSTDLSISFADALEINLEEAIIKLEVAVSGGLSQSIQVKPTETPYIEVWIVDGKMELRPSKTEVPML